MAICLRTVSNKLTPIKKFVVQGKHITLTPSVRQFPALAVKSQFLDENFPPALVNNEVLNGCKHTEINNSSLSRCPNLSNALEDWTNGSNEVFRDGIHRFERQNEQSNTEQFVLHSNLTNSISDLEGLHCFDPLSATVKSLASTPDDILWTSDTSAEHFNKQGEINVSCLNCTGIIKENSTQSEIEGESIAHEYPNPTEEQLRRVYGVLRETLPDLFTKPLDFSIYYKGIIFVNNIQGFITLGLPAYIKQVTWLRTVGHFKFAFVKFEILKITMHPEEGTVKIRWRIRGLSALKVLTRFWKYKLWKIKEILEAQEAWYDGFSTYYVSSDGLVHKHVADKVLPDDDKIVSAKGPPLVAKLAFLVAAASQEGLSEVNSLLFSILKQHSLQSIKLTVKKIV